MVAAGRPKTLKKTKKRRGSTLTMQKGRRVAVGPGPVWFAALCALACCQISSTGVLAAECASGLVGPAWGMNPK